MDQEFKERFAQFFNHVGENQSGFAERSGVQQVTVSQLLAGRSKPAMKTIAKLQNAFPNLNMAWLLDGKGEMLYDVNAPVVLRPVDPEPPTPVASSDEATYWKREAESLREQLSSVKEQLQQAMEQIKQMGQQIRFAQHLMETNASFPAGNQEAADNCVVRQLAPEVPGLVTPLQPQRKIA